MVVCVGEKGEGDGGLAGVQCNTMKHKARSEIFLECNNSPVIPSDVLSLIIEYLKMMTENMTCVLKIK